MQPCQKSRGRLHFYVQDQVGYLELDNPEARNAMSINMMSALSSMVQQIRAAEVSILVIRGVGGFFCAGGDLRDVRRELISVERGKEMCSWMTMQLQRLSSLPLYILVVVEGAAIGGGDGARGAGAAASTAMPQRGLAQPQRSAPATQPATWQGL